MHGCPSPIKWAPVSWCGICLRAVSKVVAFLVFPLALFLVSIVVLEQLLAAVAWCVLCMLRRVVRMFVPCVPPMRGASGAELAPSHTLRRDGRVWVHGGEALGAGMESGDEADVRPRVLPFLVDPTGALPVLEGPAGVPPFPVASANEPLIPVGPTMNVAVGIGTMNVAVGIGDSAVVRADHRLRVEVTRGASEYLHAVQTMIQHGHWCERRGDYREAERYFLDAWHAAPTLASEELNVCILTGLITSIRKGSRTVRAELELYVCTLNAVAVRTATMAPMTSLYARVALGSHFSVVRDDTRARLHFSRGEDIVKRAGQRDCFARDVMCALEIGHGQSWMIMCKDLHHVGDLEGMRRGRDEEGLPRFERALEVCDAPDVCANVHRMLGDVYELFFNPPELGLMEKHRTLLYEGCGRTFPETCAICLEDVSVRDTSMMILGCLHAVHRGCAAQHTQTRRAKGLPAQCAVCRAHVELF